MGNLSASKCVIIVSTPLWQGGRGGKRADSTPSRTGVSERGAPSRYSLSARGSGTNSEQHIALYAAAHCSPITLEPALQPHHPWTPIIALQPHHHSSPITLAAWSSWNLPLQPHYPGPSPLTPIIIALNPHHRLEVPSSPSSPIVVKSRHPGAPIIALKSHHHLDPERFWPRLSWLARTSGPQIRTPPRLSWFEFGVRIFIHDNIWPESLIELTPLSKICHFFCAQKTLFVDEMFGYFVLETLPSSIY